VNIHPPRSCGRVGAGASTIARLLGLARTGLGIVAILAPRLPVAPWVGDAEARRGSVRLLARALGGRDITIGLGTLLERDPTRLRQLLLLGAGADLVDASVTLRDFSHLPKFWRWGILAATSGAVVVGLAVAAGLPSEIAHERSASNS
jgi:hypothetical protein